MTYGEWFVVLVRGAWLPTQVNWTICAAVNVRKSACDLSEVRCMRRTWPAAMYAAEHRPRSPRTTTDGASAAPAILTSADAVPPSRLRRWFPCHISRVWNLFQNLYG